MGDRKPRPRGTTAGQRKALFWLLFAAGSAAAGYEWMALGDARAGAEAAARDLAACQALAARIDRLRARPPVVGTAEVDHAELSSRIERAAAAAGMPAAAVVQITPGPDRRVGDTPYLEKPTAVTLVGVGLRPLVAFLQQLTVVVPAPSRAGGGPPEPRLSLRDLRLSVPPGRDDAGGPELWSVDLTLAYRIYQPRGAVGRQAGE